MHSSFFGLATFPRVCSRFTLRIFETFSLPSLVDPRNLEDGPDGKEA
jgi:hypothetical protein